MDNIFYNNIFNDANGNYDKNTDLDYNSQLIILIVLIIILIILYGIFSFIDMDDNPFFYFIKSLLWVAILIIIFINALQYFFNISFQDILNDLLNMKKPAPINDTSFNISFQDILNDLLNLKKPAPIIDTSFNIIKEEVYHIPGARFTYHDAKAVCQSLSGELATREQLDTAQHSGASWCSYGWTQDKLALYPTSQSNFDKLQKKEGHEYDCGLPGINGGYITNPYIKFGANCYGIKPNKSKLEEEYYTPDNIYPKTKKELLFDERVEYWRKRIGNILISPFNNENWSKI